MTFRIYFPGLLPSMRHFSSEDRRLLSAELAQLMEAQQESLKTAVYLQMTDKERLLFEERRIRINELREMLAQAEAC
jgi:hypothetical protein